MYTAADRILGRLVKVTPSSKVVGDLALHLVGLDADPEDFDENPQKYDIPDSVIGFLSGELGDPPGGWPEPFRTKALQGRSVQGPRRRDQRRGQRRARRRFRRARRGDAQPPALRRSHQGLPGGRAKPTATFRCWTRGTTSSGCSAARSTRSSSRRASA